MNSHKKDLFSRQIGAVGKTTMTKLMNLNVLIIGCNSITMECIKCLALLGIKCIFIYDNTKYSSKNANEFYIKDTKGEQLSKMFSDFAKTLNPSLDVYVISSIGNILTSIKIDCVIQSKPELYSIAKLENYCMDNDIKFILCVNHGFYGYIFSNFGNHCVTDIDGEICETGFIEDIKINDDKIELTIEKLNKNLISSTGILLNSLNEKVNVSVLNSGLDKIILKRQENVEQYLKNCNINTRFIETKEEIKINHQPMNNVIKSKSYQYITVDSTFEKPTDNDIYDKYTKFITDLSIKKDSNEIFDKENSFFILSSIIGGIVAHEVIKVTGKYLPINQDIMFNFSKFMGKDFYKTSNNRNSRLLDRSIIKELKSLDVFMVGCGALGCEISKNLGMLDACTVSKSILTITDMDTIELSNLNRQFLFRANNIGEHKSVAVKSRLQNYFPKMNIKSFTYEVGKQTENIFNTVFWNNNKIIINALDNVDARKYVDSKCVIHGKPLFESGTLGTKCNTQSIIPNKTATYSEIIDEKETSIPMCTIKNFPNKIEHCVEWSLELFNNIITNGIRDLNKFINNKDDLRDEIEKLGNDYLIVNRINILMLYVELLERKEFKKFLLFSHKIYNYCYRYPIEDILTSFPDDLKDEYGNNFWSGKKLKPTIIEFRDISIEYSKYLYEVLKCSLDIEEWSDEDYNSYIEQNNNITRKFKNKIRIDEKEDKMDNEITSEDVLGVWEDFNSKLFDERHKLDTIVYDKDDSIMINLMTQLTNIRANTYNIECADSLDIRLISGKIIPALSTTTTVISGFVIVDLLRYLMDLKSTDTNINLATNQYTIFESMKPNVTYNNMFSNIYNMNIKTIPEYFNTWKKLKINIISDGCSDLRELLSILDADFSIKPNLLTYNKYIIYDSSMKFKNRVFEDIYKSVNHSLEEVMVLNICMFDENGIPIITPEIVINY